MDVGHPAAPAQPAQQGGLSPRNAAPVRGHVRAGKPGDRDGTIKQQNLYNGERVQGPQAGWAKGGIRAQVLGRKWRAERCDSGTVGAAAPPVFRRGRLKSGKARNLDEYRAVGFWMVGQPQRVPFLAIG